MDQDADTPDELKRWIATELERARAAERARIRKDVKNEVVHKGGYRVITPNPPSDPKGGNWGTKKEK